MLPGCSRGRSAAPAQRLVDSVSHLPHCRQLFTGIQVAGPRLTPEAVNQGFHVIPGTPRGDPSVPACLYRSGDFTCIKDAIAMWWAPGASSPSSAKKGCYRVPESGRRHFAGAWSAGRRPRAAQTRGPLQRLHVRAARRHASGTRKAADAVNNNSPAVVAAPSTRRSVLGCIDGRAARRLRPHRPPWPARPAGSSRTSSPTPRHQRPGDGSDWTEQRQDVQGRWLIRS